MLIMDYSQMTNRFILKDVYPLRKITTMVSEMAGYNMYSKLDVKSAYHQVPLSKVERA